MWYDHEYITTIWEDREKDGFPRLMEALHSSLWSTSVKVTKSSTVSGSSTSINSNTNSSVRTTTTTSMTVTDNTTSAQLSPKDGPTSTSSSSSSSSSKSKKNPKRSEEEQLLAIDKMETIFDQVKNQRKLYAESSNTTSSFSSSSSNNTATVTELDEKDIARRNNAARMAMELCSLMGIDDDSDSDGDV